MNVCSRKRLGGIIMLVNASEMLKKAKEGHYAVGQFNINNLEWTKAILLTAQASHMLPVSCRDAKDLG